ncbi:redoxin domain-containing protein [bacterium]|nr:redoxin domain-containing protein [bacterium]
MNERTTSHLKFILIFTVIVISLYSVQTRARIAYEQEEVSADSNAKKEFQQIVMEIRSKGRTMQPAQVVIFSEGKLLGFIEKYPDSPEAVQARIGMGQIYSSVGENEKAIAQLEMLFEEDAAMSDKDKKGVSWLLATAYLKNEDFNKAEHLLHKIEEQADESDAKLLAAVQDALGRIEALKKLALGLPALAFPDTTKDISGERVSLKDFKGKVVLLDFWATWCKPCVHEMPNVIRIYEKYHKEGFEIIGISLDKDIESLRAYIGENGIRWQQIFGGGWKNSLGEIYAVQSIPSTFLLGRDGSIRKKNLRGEALEEAIKKLVNEK